jgi:hypothetical protein
MYVFTTVKRIAASCAPTVCDPQKGPRVNFACLLPFSPSAAATSELAEREQPEEQTQKDTVRIRRPRIGDARAEEYDDTGYGTTLGPIQSLAASQPRPAKVTKEHIGSIDDR